MGSTMRIQLFPIAALLIAAGMTLCSFDIDEDRHWLRALDDRPSMNQL